MDDSDAEQAEIDEQIRAHIERHESERDPAVQVALFRLMSCYAQREYLERSELDAALDGFLDAAHLPALKTGKARVYVARFLRAHHRMACFQFFKDARDVLPERDYDAIRKWFVDGLMIDLWPQRRPRELEH